MTPRTRSILATVVLVLTVVALFKLHVLFAREPVGWTLQGLAVALMLWARATFGARSFHAAANPTEGGLVTTGPYRWWRHPIYAAVLLFLWAGVLDRGLPPAPVPALLLLVGTAATAVRIQAEEHLLRVTFPGYDSYAARTKRIVPGLF